MFERYTDEARKALQLADQEAKRFNHQFLGTEHMLLGLIKEGRGLAACALHSVGLNLKLLREEVEKFTSPGEEMVVMGKLLHSPRLKQALQKVERNERFTIETTDLLLALLFDHESSAARVLHSLNVTFEKLSIAIKALENRNIEISAGGKILLRRVSEAGSLEQENIAKEEKKMLGELLERRGWSTYTSGSALLLLEVFDSALKDKGVEEPCPALVVFLELLRNAQARPVDDQPWRTFFEALTQEVKKIEEIGDKWKELKERLL